MLAGARSLAATRGGARYDYVPPRRIGNGVASATIQSAYGTTFVSAFSFTYNGFTIPVPGRALQYHLTGSRLSITNQHTRWIPSYWNNIRLCNWQIAYQNRWGRTIYQTSWTPVHNGCTWGSGTDTLTRNYSVRRGIQCARLYVSGYFRGELCHSVYA